MTSPVRRAGAAAAAALALTCAATACTGDDGAGGAPGADPSSAAADRPAVETSVAFGRVTGRLPRPARERLGSQVHDVVDRWTRAAYLGGDYPRRDFSDSWPGFTAGAAEQARQDRELMSNQDIGERVDEVDARRSRVRIDVLAVRKRPVGVTARVLLAFRTRGDLERVVRVQGRLYLTRTGRGWQVFGYDISKSMSRGKA
jgi:hypothetical protein